MDIAEALDYLWGELTADQVAALPDDVREAAQKNHQRVAHDLMGDTPEGFTVVSFGAQLSPLGRLGQGDKPSPSTDMQVYAEQFCRYVGENLEKFASDRGGDVYLVVSASQKGSGSGAHEYRSGHYVKEESDARPNS